jgi:class 3 adenylate cyclase/predicted ATPase
MDLGGWLRSLGLERYEAAFRENEINERVLPSLTAEDLKELGVTALGHRRMLLDAIAALHTDASGKAPSADIATASNAPSASPEDRAERRQVTVMFSDLVGSTALSARMDPEDLREVISAYQKCVAETVQRLGGFVAKYMGDGVLVYFGYPQAHEDDAERAVRAGLELVAAVGSLKTHAPLQTRVGMATGLVVVGDLIGSGASQEQAIVGETPNLAARLQGIAEPNSVVIAESTRKLVGNLFELGDLGLHDLKGISGPAPAWSALRPCSVESRFDALHAGGLTELVGREEELELLLRRWSKAKAGEGQVVLLSGEPGIGKSRLTAALIERLAIGPHTRLRYFCSPQHTDSALYPIISQMERAAGFAHDDTAQAKLDKLDVVLAQTSTSVQDAALFAEMLSLPSDGRFPTLQLDAQRRREGTLEALTAQVVALSQSNPVLMIFEDTHWIDPTSLEALSRTAELIRTLGVLLIISYRPEFEPPWIGQPHVTALTVNRLGQREIAAMIEGITGNKALPASIKQDIMERTDGIPLFVEEITKAVVEAGSDEAAERLAATIAPHSVAVPASLHASLMARLDRLGAAKEVAQIGAVIGREFSHSLLAAVANKSEAELKSAVDRLVDAGLLFRQGQPPHAKYLFKHALVQDAASGTLLRDPRRALHARIAETLESQFEEVAEVQPELLARHCTEAGLIEKAAFQWGKASYRSLARSALVEAVAQITRALDQIATLPSTPDLRRQRMELQVALITPLVHVKGYAALETKTAAEQAHLLIQECEALGEPPEDALLLFSALYGCWVSSYVAFKGDVARDLSQRFLALAENKGATAPLIIGHRIVGISSLFSGDIAKGRAHFDQAIALYEPTKHRYLATRFGVDAAVSILCYRSWALWTLGYPKAAVVDTEIALKQAREVSQAASLMYAQAHGVWLHMWAGNYTAAGRLLEEGVALANEKSAMHWKALGMIGQGCLLSLATTNFSEAVRIISAGIAEYRSTGATVWLPLILSHLALAKAEVGHFDDALRCLDEAKTAIQTTEERWCEAEVFRTAGQLALKMPKQDAQKAGGLFDRALEVARQKQAKSWELRAATSMARLWRDQGKKQQARELLAPVYDSFTEGFDTLDLKEAKTLLVELAQHTRR